MNESLKAEIETIRAEQDKIERLNKRRRAAIEADSNRWCKLQADLHAIHIKALVGIPNAVKVRTRHPKEYGQSKLNDVTGTLTEVRRTRGSVEFNTEPPEVWDCRLSNLLAADSGAVVRL